MRSTAASICLMLSAFTLPSAYAEPRANSAEECMTYADLALVASTLAKHGIAKEQVSKMLPDMYELQTDNAQEIARLIVDTAFGMKLPEPRSFASNFGNSCIRHQGRFDSVFGAKT